MTIRTVLAAALVGALCCGAMARQDKATDLIRKRAEEAKQKSQEAVKKAVEPAKPAAAQPSEAEAMKAWLAAATPNENHKRLEPFVGAWDVEVAAQMDPTKPVDHAKGQTSTRWVLDGRFLLQEHTGTMMGTPFQGLGLWGYDNIEKQYIAVWADSMGTGCMTSTGQYDEKSKSWTMLGSFKDPVGQTWKTREVITLVSNDKNTFEFYQAGADGKEFKSMTIVYTRKEAPKYEIKPIEIKPAAPAADTPRK